MFARTRRALLAGILVAVGVPMTWLAMPASASTAPLVIKVDHLDPENQQPFPPFNRLFEYSDFFSRSVTVHQGDTIDFQTQPFSFHIVGLARDEAAARRAYPVVELDTDDQPAPGTGLPKLISGSGNFSVTGGSEHGGGAISTDNPKGPPVCGAVQFNQAPCTFRGGDTVEIIGPTVGWDAQQRPATTDQYVKIDAPPGKYAYFDMVHPGMRGTLTVVAADKPASTQAQIDAAGERQFQEDKAQALAVESLLNSLSLTTGTPGHRNFYVFNGASAANGHVVIDEMMPKNPINAVPGDRITFLWADSHAFHALGFAPSPDRLPPAFGYDCGGTSYQGVPNVFNVPPPPGCLEPGATTVEFISDPGTSPSGSALRGPNDIVNAGLLIGAGFGVQPTAQSWWATINTQTAKGAHPFFDAVHPWMTGVVNVG